MASEICGDGPLGIADRFAYLGQNLARNVQVTGKALRQRSFRTRRLRRTPPTASPGRALTEAFLYQKLPLLLPLGHIRVLEIGCGSGSLTRILSDVGYSGTYCGVDIHDRFDRISQDRFERTFVQRDAHQLEVDEPFDLVISISALEHIREDRDLIQRFAGFLAPGGVQLHFVPSGWGLPVYLWHGYRQYTRASLADRFDAGRAASFGLGGGASFLLHFVFITLGELLLRQRVRERIPRLYESLLESCLTLDRVIPVCPTMYAVCQMAAGSVHIE